MSTTTARGLQGEAHQRLARTAIALERYRLGHRKYPKTLAELVPRYLAEVLSDPVTGAPLSYALREGGTPAVWSVGMNGKDDGGRPKKRPTLADWVWQYELPAGYDASDYHSSKPLE